MATITEISNGTTSVPFVNEDSGISMESWKYGVAATILSTIVSSSFILNSSIIIMAILDRKMRTPMNLLLLNIILSAWLMGGAAFMSCTAAIFRGWSFGYSWCQFYGFFMELQGLASLYSITALIHERSRLTQPGYSLTNRCAVIYLALIWIGSAVLSALPLVLPTAGLMYAVDYARVSCTINWHEKSPVMQAYIFILFILGYFGPIATNIYAAVTIRLALKKSSRRLGRGDRTRTSQRDRQVTMQVAVTALAFFINWTPYAVVSLVPQLTSWTISPELGLTAIIFAKSSSLINPVIFIVMNKQLNYWGRLQQLFRRRRRNTVTFPRTSRWARERHTRSVGNDLEETGL